MSDNMNPVISEWMLKLQHPMPQYVLGLIPVVITLGTAPFGSLKHKLLWVFRCLGSPFTGLFYYLSIKDDPVEMCISWLPAESFIRKDKSKLDFKPVGLHVKVMVITLEQKEIIDNCTATASVLDRLSSLASAYYMGVGIFSGISSVTGPCDPEDWPFLTLAFLWTIPVIWKRTLGTGIIVVKDPETELKVLKDGSTGTELKDGSTETESKNGSIRVLEENEDIENGSIRTLEENEDIEDGSIRVLEGNEDIELARKQVGEENLKNYPLPNYIWLYSKFILTTLSSTILPWISVVMAYLTPPIGFFCRSKFLTVICSIWTFNSLVACICHINFGCDFLKEKKTNKVIHAYFVFSGIIITLHLFLLVLLINKSSLWVAMFGDECIINSCPLDFEM